MAHKRKKVSVKGPVDKLRRRLIDRTLRGIYVDVRSDNPSITIADVQSDHALRRSIGCRRLERAVRNIGGRRYSFVYDADFMDLDILRFSAFDLRDDLMESEYIIGNLFICSEDMTSQLRDDELKFIVRHSVAAKWGADGVTMPIVLIGDREFDSIDDNAACLSRINELLDIARRPED